MEAYTMYLPIELPPKDNRRKITQGFYVEDNEECRSLIIAGAKVLEYDRRDRTTNNVAMAIVLDLGCQKVDIARAFEAHRNTLTNIERTLKTLGFEGLIDGREGPSGPSKRTPEIMKQIAQMDKKGMSPAEIHQRLLLKSKNISLSSVYRCIADIHKADTQERKSGTIMEELPLLPDHAFEDHAPDMSVQVLSPEKENSNHEITVQEVLLGETDHPVEKAMDSHSSEAEEIASQQEHVSCRETLTASPPFSPEEGKNVSYAGAFMAWPYLSLLGFLPLVWSTYGELLKVKGKLYGLIQSVSSFFFLTLLGFDTLEAFKVADREGFRRLIGTVCSPTVKTLRAKLGIISSFGKGYGFLMGLAKQYCIMGMLEVGVLYLDGHFIPYFGKREMGKGYYTLRRLAHPGRTQHFVNDRNGRPLFFFLREANESFVTMIPELIRETHALIGEQQSTFIFDRGGQSGTLFKEIEDNGDLFITYKKGKFRHMPGGAFRPHKAEYFRWGKKFEKTYELWEGEIRITGYGNARLILVKRNGHQTPIITNDRKRSAVEVASLMFDRWRQENFFKYMAANYSIDELVTHEVHEISVALVPNPRWLELEKKIREARRKIAIMERKVGKLVTQNGETKFYEDERKKPLTTQTSALQRMRTHLKKLQHEQKECPKKISPGEMGLEAKSAIPQEGKVILDAVKLAVYNAEEWLLEIMKSHYRNWRDPRPVLRMILQQKGDYEIKDGVVRVRLQKFEDSSYQKAARGLCEVLTDLEVRSWDGKLKFEYEVTE